MHYYRRAFHKLAMPMWKKIQFDLCPDKGPSYWANGGLALFADARCMIGDEELPRASLVPCQTTDKAADMHTT